MGDYPDDHDYFTLVYDKGGAALLAARDSAGPDAFDAAIRCYVNANAWSTATPHDLAAALASLPAALTPLMQAGALTEQDVPR
jgi:aminopeptidase N